MWDDDEDEKPVAKPVSSAVQAGLDRKKLSGLKVRPSTKAASEKRAEELETFGKMRQNQGIQKLEHKDQLELGIAERQDLTLKPKMFFDLWAKHCHTHYPLITVKWDVKLIGTIKNCTNRYAHHTVSIVDWAFAYWQDYVNFDGWRGIPTLYALAEHWDDLYRDMMDQTPPDKRYQDRLKRHKEMLGDTNIHDWREASKATSKSKPEDDDFWK